MKRLFLALFLILLFIGSFYLILSSFFIPKTIIIENSQNFPVNYLDIFFLDDLKGYQEEPFHLTIISDIKDDFIFNNKTFLAINLSGKKVKLYEEGELLEKIPILALGDIYNWGGTPVGLYNIMSKHRLAFSSIANVYMPYALRFYGKYFIHGQPFFPGGRQFISEISGGCVGVSNEDARSIFEFAELNMPVLIIDEKRDYFEFKGKNLSDFPEISAKSYLVVDLNSGFVFAEENSEKQLSIASLTKLMNAIVVAENIDLRRSIVVQQKMLKPRGFTKGIEAGRRFRVVELFYPLLIESSNDSAEILSGFLGRDRTIRKMNQKAEAILMKSTEFVDPHGLSLKNVSTAQDLFQLARYTLNVRQPLLEISRGNKVRSFGRVYFKIEELFNRNIFFNDPSFVGGKTGFLLQAKHSAIFIFRFSTYSEEIRNIAIILLGSENNKVDTQRIYRWLLENYSLSPEIAI